jgi:hypothetical protein
MTAGPAWGDGSREDRRCCIEARKFTYAHKGLCIISAAIAAGVDHYWSELSSIAGIDWSKPTSRSNVSKAKPTTANPSAWGKDEVLGDRIKCDVRYQELKIPESEYRAFFDHCMGATGSTKKGG